MLKLIFLFELQPNNCQHPFESTSLRINPLVDASDAISNDFTENTPKTYLLRESNDRIGSCGLLIPMAPIYNKSFMGYLPIYPKKEEKNSQTSRR